MQQPFCPLADAQKKRMVESMMMGRTSLSQRRGFFSGINHKLFELRSKLCKFFFGKQGAS